jgi:hypothetical protein
MESFPRISQMEENFCSLNFATVVGTEEESFCVLSAFLQEWKISSYFVI